MWLEGPFKNWYKEGTYFLQYLLEKVFSINIFNLQFSFKPEDEAFDLMLFLFPVFLKRALNQGLYKEYRKFKYNDSNIRGTFDVARHIRLNVPFLGKAAYNTREYSYDNHVTQLIRHTIEYMRTHKFGSAVLHSDSELEDAVSLISQNTLSYSKPDRIKVVRDNIKPVSHPFYTEYEPLRQLCLSILRQETMLFEKDGDPIYGILFNGAWLWEEYLAVLFNERYESKFKFEHLTFENSKEYLLKDRDTGKKFQKIVPDYIDRKNKLEADAKYIPLLNNTLSSSQAEGVYYKTIMYMYRYQSPNGFIFYPYSKADDPEGIGAKKEYSIIGLDNNIIHKIGLIVPGHKGSYVDFKSRMKDQEEEFVAKIRAALEGN